MVIKRAFIEVSGIPIEVVRKKVKHLHLAVYPIEGRVRLTVPLRVSDAAVRLAVTAKLDWIKRKQAEFAERPRPLPHKMAAGEHHYFFGQPYRLNLIEHHGQGRVQVNGNVLDLYVHPGADQLQCEQVLDRWYRQQLKERIPDLLVQWEPVVGVRAADWGVKKMKTRWGSCSIGARRIWLNLELVKKPIEALEYVLVHELVHLLERRHNTRFYALMDTFMPSWRRHRDLLKMLPQEHGGQPC
ncbi:MAG: M48 family metallopeptidase [Deltaproteobacteria bacterium]|nr:M48 family metallopeptidase [Candidatus Anaeroferrophillus wilburensis]MBN2890179.1 M48 family metallopeptidase [Deltaproteobacteria bacterium]